MRAAWAFVVVLGACSSTVVHEGGSSSDGGSGKSGTSGTGGSTTGGKGGVTTGGSGGTTGGSGGTSASGGSGGTGGVGGTGTGGSGGSSGSGGTGGSGGSSGSGGTSGSGGSGGTGQTCDPSTCTSSPPCVSRSCSGTSCVETFNNGAQCGGTDPCHDPGMCNNGTCATGAQKQDGYSPDGVNFCCSGTLIGPNNPVYCGSCTNSCFSAGLPCCCSTQCCATNPAVSCP